MIETIDLFPTRLFTFKIEDEKLLEDITYEVYQNKDRMKAVSWANEVTNHEDFIVDFKSPQKVESFEIVAKQIQNHFIDMGMKYELTKYWTALYKKYSVFEMHDHFTHMLQRNNYSGILYLTNVGGTQFFTHNASSFEKNATVHSEYGRVLVFPSSLPHQVITHWDSDVERCVISFNGVMSEL